MEITKISPQASLAGPSLNEPYFTVTEYLNCRKFNKRYYTLYRPVDHLLLICLEQQFGKAQLQLFSQYSTEAKDSFQIKNGEQVQISGVLSADLLYLVTPLKDPVAIEQFETVLREWGQRLSCQY